MKKGTETGTIQSLPREIVIDILSRLPTPSLLNIKLVCQSWRSLSQDPLLIDLHFSRKTENNPCLILHNDHPIKNKLCALYLYPHSNNTQVGVVKKIPVPTMPEFEVVGSCNGWLCLCDALHKNTFHMYNPFTSSCMELPISTQPSEVFTVLGFGYHAVTKDYKVLKFSSIRRQNNRVRYWFSCRSEVQVLTVASSMSWRSLGEIPYYPIQSTSQVLLNGRLHWVNWPLRYRPGRELISFDLEDEQFREVPRPDSASTEWRGGYMLVIIRECLSAAFYGNYGAFEVWTMKDYGVKESWIKDFSIGVYLPKGLEPKDISFRDSKFYKRAFTRILCSLKNGEILLEHRRRALACYDPRCGTFKDVTVPWMPDWFEAVVHVGNLDGTDTLF